MSFIEQSSRDLGRGAGDLDGALRTFFQSQVPRPWPAWHSPVRAPQPISPRRPPVRSRLALAASVAILLAGSLGLSGAFKAHDPTGLERLSGTEVEVGSLRGTSKPVGSPHDISKEKANNFSREGSRR